MNYAKVLFDLYGLKRNSKKTARQMQRLQDTKLRRILHFAWEYSEFYRNAFEQAEILLGRDEDMFWFEDGAGNRDFLHPLAVEGFRIKGLRDYQFRKIEHAAFEMLAEVPNETRHEAVRAELQKQIEKILTGKRLFYVQFYIRIVKGILPDSATGKKSLILTDSLKSIKGAVI